MSLRSLRSLRASVASSLLLLLVGCSSANPGDPAPVGGGSSGGTSSGSSGTGGGTGPAGGSSSGGGAGSSGGSGSSGSSGSGGGSGGGGSSSSGGSSGGSGSGGSGGAHDAGVGSTTEAGASGASKCGGPLDTKAPTAASIVADGPATVASYATGLPASSAYKSLTVYYPSSGTGPYVVVMMSPGLTEILQYWQLWAQRFASYGYVAVFVEANDTNNDSEATRADGLWAAIPSVKAENTRAGSPLAGKLSDCLVTSGHSLGGGASLTIANAHPGDITGALAFNPYDPTTTFSSVAVPTLILTGQSDTTAPPAQHGRRQYDSMSTTITKEYVEISGGNHQAALFPATIPGQYAIAWIKFNVDGDARYRPFLDKAASGLSDFATTLP